MLKICLTVLISLIPFLNVFSGGVAVGNGGDVVNCRKSNENSFYGRYSLDYLLTYQKDNQNVDIVKAKSWKESAKRIEKLLKEKLPELLDSFKEFQKDYLNTTDLDARYYWQEASYGLFDLKDEDIVSLLPENCMSKDDSKKVNIIQAIIRMSSTHTGLPITVTFYGYVPKILEKLTKERPLQLSFLLLHEWLWDFSSNVFRNRKIVRFLHSDKFETFTREKVVSHLQSLGFIIPDIDLDPFNKKSCVADSSEIEDLDRRIPYGANSTGLSKFNIYSRVHVDLDPSYLYGIVSDQMSKSIYLDSYFVLYKDMRNGELSLRLMSTSGFRNVIHMSCEISSGATVICTSFNTFTGYPIVHVNFDDFTKHYLDFKGVINNGCLRLESSFSVTTSSGDIHHNEIVIFSKLPRHD